MRKIISLLVVSILLFACTNSTTTEKKETTKDSTNTKDTTNPNAPAATNAEY